MGQLEIKHLHQLEFLPHPLFYGDIAQYTFDNGYGVSIIKDTIYLDDDEYEVGILYKGKFCTDQQILDEVVGCSCADYCVYPLSEPEVNAIMERLQLIDSNP